VESLGTLLPILLIGVVFYLLIMRPARNRQRKQAEMMSALSPGARVMTTAGVYGTLVAIDEDDAEIEIAPGVVIRVVKAAIGKVIEPEVVVSEATPSAESSDGGDAAEPPSPRA
jgi:preprotein translocase subunit YajC